MSVLSVRITVNQKYLDKKLSGNKIDDIKQFIRIIMSEQERLLILCTGLKL